MVSDEIVIIGMAVVGAWELRKKGIKEFNKGLVFGADFAMLALAFLTSDAPDPSAPVFTGSRMILTLLVALLLVLDILTKWAPGSEVD